MFNFCNYKNKLPDIQGEYNLLENLLEYYKSELNLTPCLGAELEFYIYGDIDISVLDTVS